MANNPGAQVFEISLSRPNSSVSWGFRLQGGADFSTPLSIQLVSLFFSIISHGGWMMMTGQTDHQLTD